MKEERVCEERKNRRTDDGEGSGARVLSVVLGFQRSQRMTKRKK